MTRHPARRDGTKTGSGRHHDQPAGWRWYCDEADCDNATPIVPRNELPAPAEMVAAGWHVAEHWGDVCPVCLAAGVKPTSESAPFVDAPPAGEPKPDDTIPEQRTASKDYACDSPYRCPNIAADQEYIRRTTPPDSHGNNDNDFHHARWCIPCVERETREVGE